jgi:hypothetical protein
MIAPRVDRSDITAEGGGNPSFANVSAMMGDVGDRGSQDGSVGGGVWSV